MSKWTLSVAVVALVAAGIAWAASDAEDKPATSAPNISSATQPADSILTDIRAKVSYAFGMDIANTMKQRDMDLDIDLLYKAMKDTFSGDKLLLEPSEAQAAIRTWMQEQQGKQAEKQKAQNDENTKKGDEFLAKNKEAEGVVTLPSGLQYKIIEEGSGKNPTADDLVKVHYRGTLLDGTEFDSSYGRGEPATFRVKGVIPGWTEALQAMKPGAKWTVWVPATLAYGERGRPNIAPGSMLTFDVELLEIMEPGDQPEAGATPGGRPIQVKPATKPADQ